MHFLSLQIFSQGHTASKRSFSEDFYVSEI